MTFDLENVLSEWAEKVIDRIKGNLDATGTTASGKTKDSLRYEIGKGELTIYGRRYFQFVETGRPAGKIPRNFTDILYKWASDKNILPSFGAEEEEQRRNLTKVGWIIRNTGTRLYRNGGRNDIFTNVLDEELPSLLDEVDGIVRERITEIIKK